MINTIRLEHSVLVLIDYQVKLMPSMDRGEQVLAEALRLADLAIALGVPVIGTEQNPPGLGPNVDAIRERCGRTLQKTHFDACGDGLLDMLEQARPEHATEPALDIVIAGCEAHVCLLQTALSLLRAGHRVWVVAQACASRLPFNHAQAMQRLQRAGVILVGFEMIAFEWLGHCRHERFKSILPMLKAGLPPSGQPVQQTSGADPQTFRDRLAADGFVEVQTREIPPATHHPEHAHDFEVRALMLDGELELSCDGEMRTYRAGDIFTMAAGRLHAEQFGATGARYLVGRKYPGAH